MAYERPYDRIDQYPSIQPGWEIIGADGEKVGTVAAVEPNYVVVSEGFIFTSERYIPAAAVRGVEQNLVHLSVTKAEIDAQGWDSPDAVQAGYEPNRANPPRTAPADAGPAATDTEHLELREEELTAEKRTVKSDEVDVSKDVVTEREEFDVPRRHEEVEIDYRPSSTRRATDAQIGDDEEIHVPLYEEQVNVEKETVVTGEVDISKREVEDVEHVSEEVRKERLRVERESESHPRDADLEQERER